MHYHSLRHRGRTVCTLAIDSPSLRSDCRHLFLLLFNGRHFQCRLFLPIYHQLYFHLKYVQRFSPVVPPSSLCFVRFDLEFVRSAAPAVAVTKPDGFILFHRHCSSSFRSFGPKLVYHSVTNVIVFPNDNRYLCSQVFFFSSAPNVASLVDLAPITGVSVASLPLCVSVCTFFQWFRPWFHLSLPSVFLGNFLHSRHL